MFETIMKIKSVKYVKTEIFMLSKYNMCFSENLNCVILELANFNNVHHFYTRVDVYQC